ncbi:MAG TPA: RDD family protein [Planococcus sp. (in: firmicutes)]|nr:RDD family protein [Planococcus sp. (in: firmicutes)]
MTEHTDKEVHAKEPELTGRPDASQYREILLYERKPAGFWVRFWAYLIDLMVIWAVVSILVKPIFALLDVPTSNIPWYAPYTIISAIVFYGYFVLMTKFLSQTVGKMILGIRVVSLKSDDLPWGALLFREWIGRFISVTIPPLYWIVGFTRNKQGIHDFIADTTVVHEQSYRKVKLMQKEKVEGSELQQNEAF